LAEASLRDWRSGLFKRKLPLPCVIIRRSCAIF